MRLIVLAACAFCAHAVAAFQPRPLPVIDMHLHALAADEQGPPPVAVCLGLTGLPAWDQRSGWAEQFIGWMKKPPCRDAVWSPATDDGLRTETVKILNRRNIIGVLSGTPERVARWRDDAPDRIIAGLGFQIGRDAITTDDMRALHARGRLEVLAEVTNQYAGIAADDPRFEPYLALAETLDIPVGIHIGTGPPGAAHLFPAYRARLHSALQLDEPLAKHPKLRVYIMHAGWPLGDDLLALMWAHRQVYVEVGVLVWALPEAEFYRYLQRIVEAGFGNRVMFGSDQMVWPGVIEPSIRRIERAPFLGEAQKRDILYGNAARFLRLSQAQIDRHHAQ
ncbi:MAG TPA: amidohydrolase family protein [Vicinamibacterales bacterium]|nr:amidohydrolase family protein [Vicinamibacterales bacterium]